DCSLYIYIYLLLYYVKICLIKIISIFLKMKADYICDYLHNSGNIYGKACTHPEGCQLHFKARKHRPCSVCSKLIETACGRCYLHIREHYQIQYVNRLWNKARLLDHTL